MEAKELRIGNLVNTNKTITPIHVWDSIFVDMNEDRIIITPIPLTEDWLLKFGFECIQDLITDLQSNVFEAVFRLDEFTINQIMDLHVHQLQNLYFALTSEELTIK